MDKNLNKSSSPASSAPVVGKIEVPKPSGLIAYNTYIANKTKRTSAKGSKYYILSIAITNSGISECFVDKDVYDNPDIVPGVIVDLTCDLNRGGLTVLGLYPLPVKV